MRRRVSAASRPILYQRSAHVVAYWDDTALVIHNYATGTSCHATPLTLVLLDYFSSWTRVDRIGGAAGISARDLNRAIKDLHRQGFLRRSDEPPVPKDRAFESWDGWNPSTGFFHMASRDCDFAEGERHGAQLLVDRLLNNPQPSRLKRYHKRPVTSLSPPSNDHASFQVLRERRTWRRFSTEPMTEAQLGTLLGLTFGVQRWMDLGALGLTMLRTSPSAGARNPLEAYAFVRNVRGIKQGLYHYSPDRHALTHLKRTTHAAEVDGYLPGQPFYRAASIVLFVTAVFARTHWQYPFPRAYRTVMLEAGHFAQTFCLVSTALGLAPFCTAALADSRIERDLGIDGVSESVVYACGAGTRPHGVVWAPSPTSEEIPRLLDPASAKRRRNR